MSLNLTPGLPRRPGVSIVSLSSADFQEAGSLDLDSIVCEVPPSILRIVGPYSGWTLGFMYGDYSTAF